MSSLKRKFIYYKDYAGKSVEDIFEPKLLERATKLNFYEPNSLVLINNKKNGFERKLLPLKAQFSPVYGICIDDVNNDTKSDLILGGNLFAVKPEIGRYDALNGLVLLSDGAGNFTTTSSVSSGLKISGEVRHIETIRTKSGSIIAFVRNNDSIKFYKVN
jgi:enediyne biosynthesis protein E4